MSNLKQRILSALILAPITLSIVYLGGVALWILLAIAGGIMYWEWTRMTGKAHQKLLWWAIGIPYIFIPCLALAFIEHLRPGYIFLVLFFIWSVDIGAYIFGRTIGGPKIAPKISPNKTWAGLIGAIFFANLTIFSLTSLGYYHLALSPVGIVILTALLAILAQAGDFFESWVKRSFGVKDSSNIIPGHGGLLDRLDGLLFIAPFIACLIILFQGV